MGIFVSYAKTSVLRTHPLIKSKQISSQCVLLHEVALSLPYFLGLTLSRRAMRIWFLHLKLELF